MQVKEYLAIVAEALVGAQARYLSYEGIGDLDSALKWMAYGRHLEEEYRRLTSGKILHK